LKAKPIIGAPVDYQKSNPFAIQAIPKQDSDQLISN